MMQHRQPVPKGGQFSPIFASLTRILFDEMLLQKLQEESHDKT
jgi:hypothetical protein